MKRNKIFVGAVMILVMIGPRVFSQDVFRIGGSGDYLRPKGVSSSKVQEIYADTAWMQSSITLEKSEKAESALARYELRSNQIEIRTSRGISVLDARIVKSYSTVDKMGRAHEFINGKEFTVGGVPLKGLIEVLSTGKVPLYKKHGFYIKAPDYNVSLSVGNPNEQVFPQNELYYAVDKTLVKVPSKKKKLLEVFGDKSTQVSSYVDQNKLSVSKENGVTLLFNYYNSL
ncbi:MAG TPA: hypothetical protein VL728_18390 [Cyclobacteriaceae bacterium]|nr:hypothetical protein [Cyclobacteriaceae bacterium]